MQTVTRTETRILFDRTPGNGDWNPVGIHVETLAQAEHYVAEGCARGWERRQYWIQQRDVVIQLGDWRSPSVAVVCTCNDSKCTHESHATTSKGA